MSTAFPSKRRESLMISVSILRAARHGIKQTNLIRTVSLSYEQFTRYVTLLKACGFIVEDGAYYQTTEKGRELIKEFESSPLIQCVLAT
ncbi:winged helix-turn-helix domain-containing protein [Candidatus Bathyarchaeota archaeon]|nr:winged helix-turn-helix domain-containing protein [Candidatus Bathyarchaeota archaeon]